MKPEDLPSVEAVEVLPGQGAARVRVTGGRVLFLSPDVRPRASLLPVTAHGFAVLLEDWRKDGPVYHVPASVFDPLARVFDTLTPAKKKPLPMRPGFSFDHLPTVEGVEVLPDGVTRLILEDGQAVEVPDAYPSAFSPEEYAPSLLSLLPKVPVSAHFIVPDALRLPLMAALGYAQSDGEERQARA